MCTRSSTNHSPVSSKPAAELAQDVLARHRRLRERELGVAVGEVVGEVRVGGHLDARQVLVDQEQRGPAVVPVDGPRQHDEVARDVAVGDEPLGAGELVVAAVPDRLGRDRARVGAGRRPR